LTPEEEKVLREICDLVVPHRIDIGFKDVVDGVFKGYQRDKVIEKIIEGARNSDLTSITLKLIYGALQRCYEVNENGALDFGVPL
jgi:hypothetical protein